MRINIDLGNDPFILKYQGIIFEIAFQYSNGKNDIEDLISAGVIGLYKAKKTWKRNAGSKLSSWIYCMVRSEIQKEKNKEILVTSCPITTQKRNLKLEKYTPKHDKTDTNDPCKILMADEDALEQGLLYADLWRHLNGKFTELERKIIIDYYGTGLTFRQLDHKYKLTSFPIIAKAKKILREIYVTKTK